SKFKVQGSMFDVQCSMFLSWPSSVLESPDRGCVGDQPQHHPTAHAPSVNTREHLLLEVQCSMLSVQGSKFKVQGSKFDVQCSMFLRWPSSVLESPDRGCVGDQPQHHPTAHAPSVNTREHPLLEVQCPMLSVQGSKFKVQGSMFDVQCSMFLG